MTETKTTVANQPIWVDISTSDPAAAREFYSGLFGWSAEAGPPEAGGYAVCKLDGKDVAGIGPKQMEEAPTAWSIYIGTADAEALGAELMQAPGSFAWAELSARGIEKAKSFYTEASPR